jgi:hypothetical protein
MSHGGDRPCRQYDKIGSGGDQFVHDLLDGDDRLLGRENRLLLDAGDPPHRDVAFPVRLLGVDDRYIRAEGRDGRQILSGEGAGQHPDRGRAARQIRAGVPPQDPEGKARGTSHVPGRHSGVTVLLELERARMGVLDRIPQAVKRPDPGVPSP